MNSTIENTTNNHHIYKKTESTKTTYIQQEYSKKECPCNGKMGSRIAGQMAMHKKASVRVHILILMIQEVQQ